MMLQIVLFLFIIIIAYANIAIVAPNFLSIIDDLNIQPMTIGPWTFQPKAIVGFIETCFLIVMAITIIVYGYYSDKVGRKKLAYFGCTLWSIATLAIFFTPSNSYWYLLTFRIITALGISCVAPVGFSILSDLITPKNRGKVLAFWSLAFTIGALIGAVLATSFIGSPPVHANWRFPFLYLGLLGLGLTQLILLTKTPKRAQKEKPFQELIEFQGYVYKYEIKKSDIPFMWKRRTNFWLVINFVDTIPTGIMLYWAIPFFIEAGFEPVTSTFLYILLGISIFFGPLLFGWLGDNWFQRDKRGRLLMCIVCNYLSLIFIFLAVATPISAEDLMVAALFIMFLSIGLFINGGIGPNWYSTFLDVNVPENRGTMLSLALMFDSIGKGIGPFITGLFIDLRTAFFWAIIIWFISSVFWFPALFSIKRDIITVNSILSERAKKALSKNEKNKN